MLTLYFNPGVAIADYANSGESTVSFWNEFYLGMRDHISCRHGLAFTDPNGNPVDTHGDYPAAVRQVAVEQNVALIDLTARSMAYFQSLGIEGTKSVFFFLDPQVSPDYPDGVEDNSHFSVCGAIQVARLVVEGIREKNIQPLASCLK